MSLRTQGPTLLSVWCEEKPSSCVFPDVNANAKAFNAMLIIVMTLNGFGLYIVTKGGKTRPLYVLLALIAELTIQITMTVIIAPAVHQTCPWHENALKGVLAIFVMSMSWPIWLFLSLYLIAMTCQPVVR